MATVIAFDKGRRARHRSRRKAARFRPSSLFALFFMAVLFGGSYLLLPTGNVEGATVSGARFTLCSDGPFTNCVVDGDTFYLGTQSVRVADIDAPETHPSRCSYEAALGNQATVRLYQLLNQGAFTLAPWTDGRDTDQYGRLLRIVVRDGQSLGEMLVQEGLAREWTGSRQPWC